MSHDDDTAAPADRARRRRIVAAVVAAVVVAVVVVITVLLTVGSRSGRDDDDAGPSEPSGPTTTTTGPAPSDAASPSTTELPAAGPDTPEAPPVGLDASPSVVEGVTVRVKSLAPVDGQALLPGEVAGPAVLAELEIVNDSGATIDLSSTVVNLAYGADRTPANTFATGTSAFVGPLDTGRSATGAYVFAVPADARSTVRLTVDYAVDVPVVVFEGSAS